MYSSFDFNVLLINDVSSALDANIVHHHLLLVYHRCDRPRYLHLLNDLVLRQQLLLNALVLVLLFGAKRVVSLEFPVGTHGLDSFTHLVKLVLLELLDHFLFRELFFFLELEGLLLSVL